MQGINLFSSRVLSSALPAEAAGCWLPGVQVHRLVRLEQAGWGGQARKLEAPARLRSCASSGCR